MARIRTDFVAGALDAALAAGATSMSSPALADLAAVASPDVAAISLFTADSNGRITKKEIVHVTAHTAAATTATIERGKEGTTGVAWSSGDKWEHAPTVRDVGAQTVKKARRATTRVINGTAWANLDTAIDLTVPNVAADDIIEVGAMGGYVNEARFSYLDAVTVVSGSPVTSFGEQGTPPADGAGGGVSGWAGNSGSYFPNITGGSVLTLAAGDIASGAVLLRLRCRTDAAGNKTMNAGFLWWARNLGPQ